MKRVIMSGLFALVVAFVPQTLRAQGTMTYLSNLGQTIAGSLAVGSNSWVATMFHTGANANGYSLNSIQLGMADASGNPTNFMAMLYSANTFGAILPGSNLGTLEGSLNPTSAGIFTFTPASNQTLLPNTDYFIVLTAGTAVANGAYNWNYANTYSYNPVDGWNGGLAIGSNDGSSSSWVRLGASPQYYYPEFAINATAIPEPGVLGLLGLGGLAFLWHCRKAKGT